MILGCVYFHIFLNSSKRWKILWQFCVSLRAGNTVSKHNWGYKWKKFPVAALLSPRPTSYYSMEQITLVTQCLALLGFFQYAIIFSQSLINANIFLPLWQVPDSQKFFDFEQHKYLYLIQKRIWVLQFLKYEPKIFLVL